MTAHKVLGEYIEAVKELYATHGPAYNLPPTKKLEIL